MSDRKNQAWFEIKEALQLDSSGQVEEAFQKYLEGVQNLCSYIKDETKLTELSESARESALKVILTMKQSLTRVEEIVSSSGCKDSNGIRESRLPSTVPLGPTYPVGPTTPVASNPLTSPQQRMQSKALLSPEQPRELKQFQENHRPSSLGKAMKENAHLRKIFQNRCQTMKDRSQRVSLCLELQRRMQENIALAKSKEAKLRAEQEKRDSEALQLAARKLSLSSSRSPNENCSDHPGWSNKVALCACAMHYQANQHWVQEMCLQFRLQPSQFLLNTAIHRILDTHDHPLTNWFTGKRQNLRDRMSQLLAEQLAQESQVSTLLTGRNAKGRDVVSLFDPLRNLVGESLQPRSALSLVAREVCSVVETFLQVLSASLDLSEFCDGVDACYPTVEQEFFKDLWPATLQLFRLIYKDEELVFNSVCQRLKNTREYNPSRESELLNGSSIKLEAIIQELHGFSLLSSPIAKVNSLVDITHSLCDEENAIHDEKILSADDLIGLVSCLLVQSNLPQLLSELEAIEQLVPKRFLLGEEGYSLTTFQTAIKYLESQGSA